MAKLWTEAIDSHRHTVRKAILDCTWELVGERGMARVRMSDIAARAGIVRATLYKYFPDVEAILLAWHERHVRSHLEHLAGLAEQVSDPAQRLETILEAYAKIVHQRGQRGPELLALLHPREKVIEAEQQLLELLERVLLDAAEMGAIRDEIAPAEAARYCLHALGAAGSARSATEVRWAVDATLRALSAD